MEKGRNGGGYDGVFRFQCVPMCNTVHGGSHVGKRYAGNQVLYGTVNFEHSNYWFWKLGDLCVTLSQVLGPPVYSTRYSLLP